MAQRKDKLPIGVIYETDKPVFHRELVGERNPVRARLSAEERTNRVSRLLARS